MASRWSILLMGVALIQGIISFSPIPEMDNIDEEWVKFNERLENPNYRLPTTTKPRHYEVLLTPYLDVTPGPNIAAFTFDGEVTIYTSATQAVNQIVIHCNDLIIETLTVTYLNANGAPVDVTTPGQQFTCDPTTSFLTINTNEALNVNQEYIIKSTFKGNLQTNMRGFYRSWYRDTTGIRWMATTQFQPGHARQAFPCYDEPSFKATFDISISRLATFSPTISNMKLIADTAPGTSERVIDRFETTPKTSTYLLAFIVSNYGVVANNNNPARPFTIHARNNVGTAGNWALEVGEALLARMETYTGIPYYGEPLPSGMIMQQAAIPDFSAGAMENWGLLTYREALILYDPENSNHFYKQRVANIVAHEISHMWFGNLVTCAWWDNLWLNEGFARFYTYYLTDLVRPEMGFDTRFIVEQVHSALFSDSTDGAHPLTDPSVGSPTSVSNHFSTITYARGAAVLRMTQYLLGKETFEKALRSYLDARKFDVAEPEHLFKAFDDAAVADSALTAYNGVTIEEYFKTWSEKPGHPILTVKIDQTTGEMTVTQERFERTTGSSSNPSLYHVPITWTRAGASDFSNLKPSHIMTAQVEVINRGSTDLEWVVFNKQQSGFYRVNYDDTNWILLTRALRNNYKDIHEHNRAQIVDDLFAFARANVLTYDRILNVLSYLEFEDEYAPWLAAISGFNFAIRRLAHDNSQREELNQIIIGLSDSVVKTLGYTEPANEDFMLSLQRMYVMSFLCDVGHAGCIEAAKTNFAAWKTGTHIAPNLRPWVYCAGLRAGDATDFDFLWNKYLTENLASEQLVLLSAAGCTTDTASLNKFWNAIIAPAAADGSVTIRAQDTSTAITSAVTSNEENTMKSFEWLKTHFQEFETSPVGLSTVINSIFSRLLNEQQIAEARTWLNQNQVALGAAYNTGISAITTSENNLVWYEQRAAEFSSFFETGYVDQAIDSETGDGSGSGEESGEGSGEESGEGSGEESGEGSGEESGEGSGEESGEGSGEESGEGSGEDSGEDDGNNSANTAILSVATLIITLAVSILP